MTNFFLVGKNFKSNGQLFERGTVITDPSLVRKFVLKVREGKIIHVDLDNERSAYKFEMLVLKYNLDKDAILAAVNIPTAPKKAKSKKRTSKTNEDNILK